MQYLLGNKRCTPENKRKAFMSIITTLSAALPLIFLIGLGKLLQTLGVISKPTVDDFKNLIVKITVPSLLFNAFGSMHFEVRYLAIVAGMFIACILVLVGARRILPGKLGFSQFTPFMMAGFEAGMVGYALMGALYGMDALAAFAIVDLGEVLFVFLVLIPTLQVLGGSRMNIKDTLISFIKNPIIIAIFVGLGVNFSGLYQIIANFPVTSAILQTIQIIGGLTTPLVALVLGYELNIAKGQMRRPIASIVVRLLVWIGLGLILNIFLIDRLLGLGIVFQAAVMQMCILPPPFVVPFFMQKAEPEEQTIMVNTLTLATLITLAISVVLRGLMQV